MLGRIALVGLLCGFGTITVAEVSVENCLKLTVDAERLSCYDNALGYKPEKVDSSVPASQEPTSDLRSNWSFVEKFDKFTDKNTSYLALTSEQFGRTGEDPPDTLVMRCDGDGGYQTYMVFDGYVGDDDGVTRIRYRFADGKPEVYPWQASASGKAAFLPDRFQDFRVNLFAGKDFIFEVTDYQGMQSSAEFKNSLDPKFDFIKGGCKG